MLVRTKTEGIRASPLSRPPLEAPNCATASLPELFPNPPPLIRTSLLSTERCTLQVETALLPPPLVAWLRKGLQLACLLLGPQPKVAVRSLGYLVRSSSPPSRA